MYFINLSVSQHLRKIVSLLEFLPSRTTHLYPMSKWYIFLVKISNKIDKILCKFKSNKCVNWDPWILKDGNIYRLFYLEGVEGLFPFWKYTKIRGAISTDLEHWQDLGTILEPNPANDWESGRVCAGYTYKEDDVYYLFYSAAGQGKGLSDEAIGLATSTDGLQFSRYSNYPLIKPDIDNPWYSPCNSTGHFHWRDPYIIKDPHTGQYFMFICATCKANGNFHGGIGLAVSDNITGPYHIKKPALEVPIDVSDNWLYYHLERPQVIYKNGKYNLFFSCWAAGINPIGLQGFNKIKVTNSSLYWYVSDKIDGSYEPVDKNKFIVKGSERTGLYATNFFQLSNEPEKLMAYGWYHRLRALEVSPVFPVNWEDANTLEIRRV